MGFFKEFKEFVMRGNVIDMAVGVVIGGAFGKIVTSLVNDVVMPPIGLAIGGVAFSELKATLKPAILAEDGETVVKEAVTLNYGNFIQTILEFLIIALCIFIVIRTINKIRKKIEEKKAAEEAAKAAAEAAAAEAAAEEAPAAPTEAELLAEIRDLLKKEKGEA
ncbi:MAG: large-conductance mechanosensitive channel protein MscL [Clostridia bacterium]|nr:large-conductance mechanosensitive channel protein MscL [Clostridia bacterium]